MKGLMFLIQEMKPYRGRILLALLLSALTITSHIGLMATAAYLLARAALHPSVMELMIAIVGVRFFGISRAVFRYFERYVSHDVTFRILSRIRVRVYETVEPLAPARLTYIKSGDLLSRIVGDVEIQQNLFLRVLAPPFVALLVLVGFGVFLAPFDQRFSFLLAGFFLLGGIGLPFGLKRLSHGAGKKKVIEKAQLQIQLLDMIQGMTELLSFGQEQVHLDKFKTTQKRYSLAEKRYIWLSGLSGALLGIVSNLGMWLVLVLGIILVNQGQLNGVNLGMLALGFLSSFEAIQALPTALQNLEENKAAAERLWELNELEPEVRERQTQNVLSFEALNHKSSLEVNGLNFRYEQSEEYVLKDISLQLPQRGKVGIVGPSGAGKSSLVNLLLRFWDYQEGEIRVEGKELKSLPLDETRQLFGVVTQKTHLFNASVKDNLLLANPQARDEELFEACRKAKIHDFILSLPEGYESMIGEEGLKLSGGQRQRLAIARVILKNAPILILDEATTGLDPVTERDVMQEIMELFKDRPVLVISHHLPIVQNLDEILVINKGEIVERGNHEELMKNGNLYKKLWEKEQLIFC